MHPREAVMKATAELDKASQAAYQIDQARLHQQLAESWTTIAQLLTEHPECM